MGGSVPTKHAQLPGLKSLSCPTLPARQKKAPSSTCTTGDDGIPPVWGYGCSHWGSFVSAQQAGWTTCPTAGDGPGLCARLNEIIMNLARIISLFQLYSLNSKSGTAERASSRCSFQVWNFLDRQWNTSSFNQLPRWMSLSGQVWVKKTGHENF